MHAELRACQPILHCGQAHKQCLARRQHNRGMTAQYLGLVGRARRHVDLVATDVDPHVGQLDHYVRIAGQSQSGDVEQRRDLLIRYCRIDMLQRDTVAQVFVGGVELLLHGVPLS